MRCWRQNEKTSSAHRPRALATRDFANYARMEEGGSEPTAASREP